MPRFIVPIWNGFKTAQFRLAMRTGILFLLGAVATAFPPAQAQSATDSPYRLSAGDQISIAIALNPELNSSGPIGPDGRFSIPLAGVVHLTGLTIEEAQNKIADQLKQANLVADARPSIMVTSYGGTIYVGGEVRNPGAVPLNRPLNPLQAIISAGGMLETAKTRRIAILRASPTKDAGRYDINVREYIRTGNASEQPSLLPGDIIFVPRSGIAEINLWIKQHINGIIPDALNFTVLFGNGSSGSNAVSINP